MLIPRLKTPFLRIAAIFPRPKHCRIEPDFQNRNSTSDQTHEADLFFICSSVPPSGYGLQTPTPASRHECPSGYLRITQKTEAESGTRTRSSYDTHG